MAAAGWGMAASSAMDLFSGFLDRNAAPSKGWQRQVQLEARQYDYDKAIEFRDDQRRYDASQIQRTVADAKAAGVHPLFALGGRASGSGAGMPSPPTSGGSGYIPGQHSTGSGIGTGLRAAARGIRGIAAGQPTALEASQTNLNTARAMQIASETKRDELIALNHRSIPGELGTAQAWPLGGGPSAPRLSTSTDTGGKYWVRSPGGNVLVDPRYPGTEWFENRYGETADYVHGAPLYVRERFTQNPRSYMNWKRQSGPRRPKIKNYWDYRVSGR